MTSLTVCPDENKPTILSVSIKWLEHEIATHSIKYEIFLQRKKNRLKFTMFLYASFFILFHILTQNLEQSN